MYLKINILHILCISRQRIFLDSERSDAAGRSRIASHQTLEQPHVNFLFKRLPESPPDFKNIIHSNCLLRRPLLYHLPTLALEWPAIAIINQSINKYIKHNLDEIPFCYTVKNLSLYKKMF